MRAGAFIAGAASIGFGLFVFACSLGLDESLIDKKDASPVSSIDANLPDGTTVTESGVPEVPNGQPCKVDGDCVAANACLTGRCDQARQTCAFDVCRPVACSVGTCNQTAKTCGASVTYKEAAANFTLPAPIACGNCIAAAYPYLFVGTTLGVLAYNVGNIALVNPATVPITGLGFVPQAMVRSGNRLWMTGGPSGAGAASTFPVAYIDIPADPFATSIVASTHLVAYNRPAEGYGIFARDSESLLVYSLLAPTYPASFLTAPLADPATLTATALAPGDGYGPVAASGTRLLLASVAASVASFQLVNDAGSATPANAAVVTIPDAAVVSSNRAFAEAPDGTVFWSTGLNNPPSGAPVPTLTTMQKVRGYFLVGGGTADISGAVTGVDIEVFANTGVGTDTVGANGSGTGPAAMLDTDTAMTTTAAAESVGALTAINFVKRGAPPTIVAGKRVTIPAPITSIAGASGSNGLGYVVANDPPAALGDPTVGHVYVFDSACAQ